MGYYASQALYVAARLGVADHLTEGPRSADELAEAVSADAPSLFRVLRLLASRDVFRLDDEGRFHLNEAAEGLLTHPSGSMKDLILMFGDEFFQAFANLLVGVQTGTDAFRLTFGAGLFEYLEAHPDRARTFDRAMAAGEVFFESIPDVYDFSGHSRVVDVGGGNGALLGAILRAVPGLKGIVYDSVSVVQATRAILEGSDLAGRLDVAAGDFFESIVGGGDPYVFSRVLHDWSDEQCRRILRNCREAADAGCRLLIVERLLPDRMAVATDVNMLALTNGKERSAEEFGELLRAAGFELREVRELPLAVSLIVAEAV